MVYNGNKKFIKDNYLLCAVDLKPEDIDNISEGNDGLMEFKNDLEKINDDEDFVNWISSEKEAEMFERTRILIAEEEATKRGLKKGLEQGIEQGIKKGIIETAKKMKNENIDIDTIRKITNLSIEEINKL